MDSQLIKAEKINSLKNSYEPTSKIDDKVYSDEEFRQVRLQAFLDIESGLVLETMEDLAHFREFAANLYQIPHFNSSSVFDTVSKNENRNKKGGNAKSSWALGTTSLLTTTKNSASQLAYSQTHPLVISEISQALTTTHLDQNENFYGPTSNLSGGPELWRAGRVVEARDYTGGHLQNPRLLCLMMRVAKTTSDPILEGHVETLRRYSEEASNDIGSEFKPDAPTPAQVLEASAAVTYQFGSLSLRSEQDFFSQYMKFGLGDATEETEADFKMDLDSPGQNSTDSGSPMSLDSEDKSALQSGSDMDVSPVGNGLNESTLQMSAEELRKLYEDTRLANASRLAAYPVSSVPFETILVDVTMPNGVVREIPLYQRHAKDFVGLEGFKLWNNVWFGPTQPEMPLVVCIDSTGEVYYLDGMSELTVFRSGDEYIGYMQRQFGVEITKLVYKLGPADPAAS